METNNQNDRPVDELRLGRITATIWRNRGKDDKTFHNVQLTRLYRDGENWMRTTSFGRDDLLVVAKLADLAHTRIHELRAEARRSNGDDAGAPADA